MSISYFYLRRLYFLSKKRKYIFLSNWDRYYLKCACLFNNPLCKNNSECEEIELTLSPYDNIESCMRERG